jgi:hypothetical protein
MIQIIELTGNETDTQLQLAAWEMFCAAHPHEAFKYDPEGFWKYFQTVCPDKDRETLPKN